MSEITLVNGSAPSTPSAGRVAIYGDSADKHVKIIDDTGTVTDLTTGGGGGGQTDTVVGSGGITNTGDNVDADLTPTYGSAASTVCEGDDPRLSDARVPTGSAGGDLAGTYANPSVAAITETSGPTSLTIGAIVDGEALRRSGAAVVGYAPIIVGYPIGSKFNDLGKFGIANGKSSDNDDTSKPKTRQPIAVDGTIVKVAYQTQNADITTQMKIHISGIVQATFTLASINANLGGSESVSVAVSAGDYIEIELDAGTTPNESTWLFVQEVTL